jgi:DNA transformation protein
VANTAEFLDHLRELMRAAGYAVAARAMFGGHGLYVDAMFFGIVDDDVLYLRADERTRAAFGDAAPFEFMTRDGKRQAMKYLQAPDEALERPDAMAHWVRLALGAALRAAAAGHARKKKPSRTKPATTAVVAKTTGRKRRS